MTPIDAAARAELHTYLTDLANSGRTEPVTNSPRPEYVYQRLTTGDTEYNIAAPGTEPTWADGINHLYGLAQDAKFRGATSSFYDPSSVGSPGLRTMAIREMDRRLDKYRKAIA